MDPVPGSSDQPSGPAARAADPADRNSTNTSPLAPTEQTAPLATQLSEFEVTPYQLHPRPAGESLTDKVRTWLIGKPRDIHDQSIFHHISLVAFLAWVGLGADGLSSSCYGPAEAFHNLGEHAYLAVFLAAMTIGTVLIISACYSHIIEEFPSGGGGYLVASKLLGRRVGVVSGSALLVDYVLTITVSVTASCDAVFGLLPHEYHTWKLPSAFAAIVVLIVLNLRGVKESVVFLLPIFIVFLVTHALVIGGALGMHLPAMTTVTHQVTTEVRDGLTNPNFGFIAMFALLMHAYSLGAGTYTGIEAVSNSMPVLREPRVATGKRTMLYMALSLSATAGGLMLAYLLMGIRPQENVTMNQVLTGALMREVGIGDDNVLGTGFVLITILSEGLLLIVAAQAGFIDGPRVLANMARDSWLPHWFGSLSERLAMRNGVLLMGVAALGALAYSGGNLITLLTMYSINVFLTFSLSMIGMCRHWWQLRAEHPFWLRRLTLFFGGGALCVVILIITIYEKFNEGAWLTLVVTGITIGICFLIQSHYRATMQSLKKMDEQLTTLATSGEPSQAEVDPQGYTAAILVGGYSGLGVHTLVNALRFAPGHYKNVVFLSVGVVDSGNFKGAGAVEELEQYTASSLDKYVDLARRLGFAATSYMSVGTDVVEELERLCQFAVRQFPRTTIFAGQLVFRNDTWFRRWLHNETAFALQRRLQWDGIPMVILPTRVTSGAAT